MKIACIIPTYNGRAELIRLLNSIEMQNLEMDVYVVDSSSTDGTKEVAEQRLSRVIQIDSVDFDHGGTRQMMVDRLSGYDIFVFLTQDANLHNKDSIRNLLRPFRDHKIAAVCGRQLPHEDANPIARHARLFNYPSEVVVRSPSDIERYGIKAAFMSNSFAAYRATALKSIGGFPKQLIFAEDMYAAAKMLLNGWSVVYAGDALCRHSHNYSIKEEFRRYFDVGVFHATERWIANHFGGPRGEGIKFIVSEFRYLSRHSPLLLLSALTRNVLKLTAYKLGKIYHALPTFLVKKLSMNRRYWDKSRQYRS